MKAEQKQFINLIRENKGIIYKICNSYCTHKDNRDDLAQEIIYNLCKSFNIIRALGFLKELQQLKN